MTHTDNVNYTGYNYSIYTTKAGHYVFPGYTTSIIGDEQWLKDKDNKPVKDIVILYKDTDQISYVDNDLDRTRPKYSDYIFDFKTDALDWV